MNDAISTYCCGLLKRALLEGRKVYSSMSKDVRWENKNLKGGLAEKNVELSIWRGNVIPDAHLSGLIRGKCWYILYASMVLKETINMKNRNIWSTGPRFPLQGCKHDVESILNSFPPIQKKEKYGRHKGSVLILRVSTPFSNTYVWEN